MVLTLRRAAGLAATGLTILGGCTAMQGGTSAQPNPKDMTFFVTSAGRGMGANYDGLEGADRHCASLAQAAGSPSERVWRAYLSTQAPALNDPRFVNARDRIGPGPWRNALGVVVAHSVDDLHSASNNITQQTALDEKGQRVNGRADKPNKHDILTGSRHDGTAFPGAPFPDMTCGNWTKGGTEGSAMLGHHDRAGPIDSPWATSWNSSHPTRGCDQQGLRSTGGDGLMYCFAVK